MAAPPCMSDDGNPAVFVGTMLQTGDAVALCDECLVPWAAALLNAMTGVDPTPFLIAISDDAGSELTVEEVEAVEREAEILVEGDPPKPSGRSGRTSEGSRGRGTANGLRAAPTPRDREQDQPAA